MIQAVAASSTRMPAHATVVATLVTRIDWLVVASATIEPAMLGRIVERTVIDPLTAMQPALPAPAAKLARDAVWELAAAASLGDTLDPTDPDDRDAAEQGLDEAGGLLRRMLGWLK